MVTTFSHRNLPRLLLQARESVMAHTRPSLRQQALSDQQWRVLRVLGEDHSQGGQGVETGRVAREAYLLGPSLTGVLARMERDGLITRERDPQDQRRSVVRPTEQGLGLVNTLSRTIEAHYVWLEQSLGKDKLALLYGLLDELIQLEGPADAPPSADAPAGAPARTTRTANRSTLRASASPRSRTPSSTASLPPSQLETTS
jgi:homoprotocatechuate degradation regulator HpaR